MSSPKERRQGPPSGCRYRHSAKKDKKKKGKAEGDDQSLLMLASTKVSSDDTIIDYALQAKTAKHREMAREHAIWIMDSGATSHMNPHAHIFHNILRP